MVWLPPACWYIENRMGKMNVCLASGRGAVSKTRRKRYDGFPRLRVSQIVGMGFVCLCLFTPLPLCDYVPSARVGVFNLPNSSLLPIHTLSRVLKIHHGFSMGDPKQTTIADMTFSRLLPSPKRRSEL